MSSTRNAKSSTPKFWKKFSLGKKSTTVPVTPEPDRAADVDDDRSLKSKRLSVSSLRGRQPQQQEPVPPTPSTLPPFSLPVAPSIVTTSSGEAPAHHVEETYPVLPAQPISSSTQAPLSAADIDNNNPATVASRLNAVSPPSHSSTIASSSSPPSPSPSPVAPVNTTDVEETLNVTHISNRAEQPEPTPEPSLPAEPRSNASHSTRIEAPVPTTGLRPGSSKSSSSLSSQASSSICTQHQQRQQPTQLRKPSKIPGKDAKIKEAKSKLEAGMIQQKASGNSEDAGSDEDPQTTIQKLREELEGQRSIILVLQRQKEAVAKDLDYFNQMLDEMMEEKDALQLKYEEEKEKNKSREEDLNVLLEKLRSSNDIARTKSAEAAHWKAEVETIQKEAQQNQEDMNLRLKNKNREIEMLKAELSQAHDHIGVLKSTMDQLIQSQAMARENSPSTQPSMETPTASPHTKHADPPEQRASPELGSPEALSIRRNSLSQPLPTSSTPRPSIPVRKNAKNSHIYNTLQSSLTRNESDARNEHHDLDNQLLKLTQEKEKLQSDYSKIPLSGGGPMSRRRKEELEEMLDEVDSQLSRVKQKIRRS
ncbi:hypothetical protein BX666DRAFT_2024170 [Dichotomocladium elegans]|nr:hypothetical protein BX666DRAFT_2024170 [Dichotomocladium elegans]